MELNSLDRFLTENPDGAVNKIVEKASHIKDLNVPDFRSIDEYLDRAIEGLKAANEGRNVSDRELSLYLKLGPTAVSNYRTKRAWPSDETMAMIALLGKEDVAMALLSLNIWRSKSPTIRLYYSLLQEMLVSSMKNAAKAISVLVLGLFLLTYSENAAATNGQAVRDHCILW